MSWVLRQVQINNALVHGQRLDKAAKHHRLCDLVESEVYLADVLLSWQLLSQRFHELRPKAGVMEDELSKAAGWVLRLQTLLLEGILATSGPFPLAQASLPLDVIPLLSLFFNKGDQCAAQPVRNAIVGQVEDL